MSVVYLDMTLPDERRSLIARLEEGEVVVLPTWGLYGFSSLPEIGRAWETLFELKKGRDRKKGFILLASDLEMVEASTGPWPAGIREFLSRTWPAPLSVLLPSLDPESDSPASFRVPPHEPLRRLIRALGRPILSTSTNRHGTPPLLDPKEIVREFFPPLIYFGTGGPEPAGLPSTLVDLTVRPPRVLREGAFPWREDLLDG